MLRLGIVIDDNWRFFSEIYDDLNKHYNPSVFKRRTFNLPVFHERVNRFLFQRDLKVYLQSKDVVLFEWANEFLVAATQLPKRSAMVVRLHRYEMYEWADKVNWDRVDKIILVSHAKEQEFIYRFPAQRQKTVVIPAGINIDRFQPSDKPFNGDIGILCDLIPRKRVYDLIIDFYELLKQDDNFHLHIGGGSDAFYGDYYLAVLDLIKRLRLQDKITLYGKVVEPQKWYHKIDIFVSHSYSEGLQVAPMEAMASGCYCLSHYWTGANELLPAENLYVSHTELCQKIMQFSAKSADEKKDIADFMRQYACDNFDIEPVKAKIRTVLEEAARQGRMKENGSRS